MSEFPKLLVVDDDPAIRRLLSEMLSLDGYQCELAANGQEALDLLRDGIPRVILLDLLMPVVDGRGVIEALNATPDQRSVHVIVLVSAIANLECNSDLGVDLALVKPFNLSQLTVALQQAMQVYETRKLSCRSETRVIVPTIKLAKRLSFMHDGQVDPSSTTDETLPRRLQTLDRESDNARIGAKDGAADNSAESSELETGTPAEPPFDVGSASAKAPSNQIESADSNSTNAVELDQSLGDFQVTSEQQADVVLSATPTSPRRKRRRWLW